VTRRRSYLRETYFTARCAVAGYALLQCVFHHRTAGAVVAAVAMLTWLVRANDEACRP
jgi:hypothetical protein